MSKCDITIMFKQDRRTYQPGDTIEGTVHVDVNKEVVCKKFEIEFLWQTHGKGNRDNGVIDTISNNDISWFAGSSYTYDFSFTVPHYPLSYHGHILNVDYYIRARADIPWAIDPKKEEDLLVSPGPESRDYYLAEMNKEKTKKEKSTQLSQTGKIIGWIIGLVFLGMLVFLFVAFWWIFILIALGIAIQRWMHRLAEKKLGPITLNLSDPTPISPGQALPLTFSFMPGGQVTINTIEASLIGQEVCVSGSGTNRTTHRHTLHEEKTRLSESFEAYSHSYQEFKTEFMIPDIPAYAFKSSDNRIDWSLKIHVDIPRYPDWKKTIALHLVPENKTQQ
ncbi:sporulation protein [bacterium]|nr:sporulation protein [bacterium]